MIGKARGTVISMRCRPSAAGFRERMPRDICRCSSDAISDRGTERTTDAGLIQTATPRTIIGKARALVRISRKPHDDFVANDMCCLCADFVANIGADCGADGAA